jgi:hypothetical protein
MRSPLFSAFLVLAGLALAGAASVGAGDPAARAVAGMVEVRTADSSGCPYLDGRSGPGGRALRLPPGHPPVDGFDEDAAELPPGHPPIDGAGRLPPGHPPVEHAAPAPRFDGVKVIDL